MRTLSQGAPRLARARVVDRTRVDRRPRRGGTAARPARLIGAIIAGGANLRFGGLPKGLQPVGGLRIIDRVANTLRSVTDDIIIVSNAPEASSWIPGVRVARDVRSERGSLVGIHTAITAAADDVLVAAWDMPFVNHALFQILANRLITSGFAVVPNGPHGLEGLCAAYTRACLPAIEAALDAGDLRVSAMIDRLPAVDRVSTFDLSAAGDPERLFFNVNSAADLAAADRMSTN